MTTRQPNTVSRRNFLELLSTGLAMPSLASALAQHMETTSNYTGPDPRLHMNMSDLLRQPPCSIAQRRDAPLATGRTTKLFVTPEGDYMVRSIEALAKEGWIRQHHARVAGKRTLSPNPQAGDPDIRNAHGSGVMLRSENGKMLFLSNDHVLCAGRRALEEQRASNWAFDIASISPSLLRRNPNDGDLPEATIAPVHITNSTLSDISVDVYGIGGDLFFFRGKPFSIPFSIPSLKDDLEKRTLFGIRIPDGFLHHPAEVGGMSGSPVLLSHTDSVVGLVIRVHSFFVGSRTATAIIFAGPDEVRALSRS